MKFRVVCIVLGAYMLGARSTFASNPPGAPVVVQLFTSEGCSSCPPADKLLAELTDAAPGVTIIPMSMHVDYWDRLGWRDPFSSAQFSEIQQRYQQALKTSGLYTPQMIVDGRTEFVGSDRGAAKSAIAAAAGMPKASVSLQLNPSTADASLVRVKIDIQRRDSIPADETCDVVLVVTEDDLTSEVRKGENAGRSLHHTAVVRSMEKIDQIAATEASKSIERQLKLNPSWKPKKLHILAIVQLKQNLRVYGAATTPLSAPAK